MEKFLAVLAMIALSLVAMPAAADNYVVNVAEATGGMVVSPAVGIMEGTQMGSQMLADTGPAAPIVLPLAIAAVPVGAVVGTVKGAGNLVGAILGVN